MCLWAATCEGTQTLLPSHVKVTHILRVSRESRSALNISSRPVKTNSICVLQRCKVHDISYSSSKTLRTDSQSQEIRVSFIIKFSSRLQFCSCVHLFELWNTMDYMEQMDEDQLIDFVIQMSLQDACSLSVMNEPLRYVQDLFVLKQRYVLISHIYQSLMQHFRNSQWWKPQDFISYRSRCFIRVPKYHALFWFLNGLIFCICMCNIIQVMCLHWGNCTTVLPIRKETAKVGFRCTERQSSWMLMCWTASSWVSRHNMPKLNYSANKWVTIN